MPFLHVGVGFRFSRGQHIAHIVEQYGAHRVRPRRHGQRGGEPVDRIPITSAERWASVRGVPQAEQDGGHLLRGGDAKQLVADAGPPEHQGGVSGAAGGAGSKPGD
jgi:hypothetical protein